MFSVEVTNFALLVYVMQVLLLPIQLGHYFFNLKDNTRRRYLVLGVSFVLFNSLWVLPHSFFNVDPVVQQNILAYSGILLLTVAYRYLVKEINITTNKLIPRTLFLVLVSVQFFRELALFNLTNTNDFFVELSFALIFTVVVAVFCIKGIIHLYQKQHGVHHAMFFAAIATFIVASFLPLVIFCAETRVPAYFLINLVFALISLAYLRHYLLEVRSKRIFPKMNNETDHLNLDERFFKVPDSISELDLTARQQEIASLILQGKSYKEIAAQLFLSYPTVRGHAATTYKKAGITGDKKMEEFRKKFGN